MRSLSLEDDATGLAAAVACTCDRRNARRRPGVEFRWAEVTTFVEANEYSEASRVRGVITMGKFDGVCVS